MTSILFPIFFPFLPPLHTLPLCFLKRHLNIIRRRADCKTNGEKDLKDKFSRLKCHSLFRATFDKKTFFCSLSLSLSCLFLLLFRNSFGTELAITSNWSSSNFMKGSTKNKVSKLPSVQEIDTKPWLKKQIDFWVTFVLL